jgi:two-component system, NarL family, sensor kinase
MDNTNLLLAIVCTTLIILLLVGGVILSFILSAQKQKQQALILAQTKLDFEQEIRLVETEVSEQIMGQFARELHDNIGQLLTATHIQIENQKLDHPSLSESFKPVEIYLNEVTQQLRLLSRTLNHDYIGHVGLFSAMQLEINRLNQLKRFEIQWYNLKGESNLSKNQELMVFRIFQEVTQNALRYSGAKNMHIEVSNNNAPFEMLIQDDGKGFNLEVMLNSEKASGLKNILKRARLAGLDCQIEASENKGCKIILKKSIL